MISIVMPVRNAEPFLEACLDSIIKQSLTDWELMAINDHSNDESFSILKSYSERDNRIKVKQNTGKGIIDALKLAFKNTSGQYITRMDADDIMPTNKLELLYNNLLPKGLGWVSIGMVKYFSDQELGEGYKKYADWLNHLSTIEKNFSEIYKECVIPSPNWMMSKKDFISIGAFNSDQYPEDYDLCFRMLQGKMKICSVKEVTHHWRDHDTRASRNDDNYKDNSFLPLKLKYFLKLHNNAAKKLILWGAGKKGKMIAQALIKKQLPFIWVTNNEKKQGINIYDQTLCSIEEVGRNYNDSQVIIAIAAKNSKSEILNTLERFKLEDFYFFC